MPRIGKVSLDNIKYDMKISLEPKYSNLSGFMPIQDEIESLDSIFPAAPKLIGNKEFN